MEFQSIPGIPKAVSTSFHLQHRDKQQLNYTQGNFIFTCTLFLPISNRNRQKNGNLAAPPHTEKSNFSTQPSPAGEARSKGNISYNFFAATKKFHDIQLCGNAVLNGEYRIRNEPRRVSFNYIGHCGEAVPIRSICYKQRATSSIFHDSVHLGEADSNGQNRITYEPRRY